MKIVRFKHWFQVKNDDGFTITQFLNERDSRAFIGGASPLPCADLKLGNESVHQKRGQVVKRIKIYP